MRLSLAVWLLLASAPTWSHAENRPSPRRFALVIGIGNYPRYPEAERLAYASNDALRFAAFLESKKGGALDPSRVRILIDREATRDRIYKEIAWIGREARATDIVYFFYSGHGATDGMPRAYFMPWDASPQQPEAMGIKMNELLTYAEERIEARVIFVVDACHAGAALNPDGTAKGPSDELSTAIADSWRPQPAGEHNMGIFSSRPNQQSWEDPKVKQGVFSYHLLRGLDGGALCREGEIHAGDLVQFVIDEVRTAFPAPTPIQRPVTTPSFDDEFPLAKCGKDFPPFQLPNGEFPQVAMAHPPAPADPLIAITGRPSLEPLRPRPAPVYRRLWFWALVGGVVAVGTASIVALALRGGMSCPPTLSSCGGP